jgi:hypothetical protein
MTVPILNVTQFLYCVGNHVLARNLLIDAIDCDNADVAATMIRDALGIETDEVVN